MKFLSILLFLIIPTITLFSQNDECGGAINIIPDDACTTVDGDLTGATASNISGNSYNDVWFSFTANTTTHYISVVGTGDFYYGFQVYSGTCGGTLTSVGSAYTGYSPATFQVITGLTVGQKYYYRVYHSGYSAPTTPTFTTCVQNFIKNDNCSGAIEITVKDACSPTQGMSYGATQSMPGCSGNADDDVWYKFKATNAKQFIHVIGLQGASSIPYDPEVQVFSGAACASLSSVICTDNTSIGQAEDVSLTGLTVGNYYYVRVYHASTGASTVPVFNICITQPPANDDCSGATAITPSLVCTGEFGDGTYASKSISGSVAATNDDVWYKFVADTTVHFISITSSTSYDPVVELFSNCTTALTPAVKDDASFPKDGTGTTKVTGLTPGTTYYYRVYDAATTNPATMTFTTCVTRSPKNDDCANAIKLTPNATCYSTAGDGTYASKSISGSVAATNDDVWYKFDAQSTTQFINITASMLYDPVVEVFSACGTAMTPAFKEDASYPVGAFGYKALTGLTIGATYYYRVYDAASTNPATMTFSTCVTNPPSNDDCSGAKFVTAGAICDTELGNGMYATQSLAQCLGSAGAATDDVWFKFTAQSNSQFISVDPSDSKFDPVIQVFSACGTAMVPPVCNDASFPVGNFGNALVTGLTSGNTYYYRVYDISTTNQDSTSFTTCVVNAVVNDDCAGAINVTPGQTCNPIEADALYASQSLAQCTGSAGAANDDVWFKFTATKTTQFISVTPEDKGYDPVVEVYSGCGTPIAPAICNDANYPKGKFGTNVVKGLTVGNTYYYRVYDISTTNQDTMKFTTCVVEPVINDDCTNATNITPGTICNPIAGDGTYASLSLAECTGSAGAANDDVWYKFTAVTAKEFITVQAGTGYDPVVQVFSACGTPLAPAICNDAGYPVSDFGTLPITTIPGNTYYYRVYDKGVTNTNPLVFTTCVAHAPANDECSGATLITSGASCSPVNGEGTYATQSVVASATCAGNADDDVWFKFVATATSQNINITSSLDYDPVVQVYSGCGATPSTPVSFPAPASTTCNDTRFSKDASGSYTVTGLTTGTTYYYRVYDAGSTSTAPLTFTTCVTNIPSPPVNDEPCSAILITPTFTCSYQTYTNEAATASAGITAPGCAGYSGGDVWFKVKVPFSGQLTFDTKAMSILDGGMALYKGATCSSLTLISCDDNTGAGSMPQIAKTGLTPGDYIYVRVWENGNNNNGNFGLCITKGPEALLQGPCANLDFEAGYNGWFGTYGSEGNTAGVTKGVIIGSASDLTPKYVPTVLNTFTPPQTNEFDFMSGGLDPFGGFPMRYQGGKTLRLGTDKVGTNNGRSIEQYFSVTPANNFFVYNYAAVLNGDSKHKPQEQPFFKVEFFDDNGVQIGCGDYLVAARNASGNQSPGFFKSAKQASDNTDVFYRPWTTIGVNLKDFEGKNVHVRFTSTSCSSTGHFGYVYLDCSCAPFEIPKPAKVCLGDSARLYAPKGGLSYTWKDLAGTIVSTKDSLVYKTTVAGINKFTCDVEMFGTTVCKSTLNAEVEVGATPTLVITDPAAVCSPNKVDITAANVTTGSTIGLTLSYWKENPPVTQITSIDAAVIASTGTYYIKGEKSPTCLDIKPVNVTVNPTPIIVNKVETICSEASFTTIPANTLPDVVPAGTQYTWTVVDNPNITGESSQATKQNNISQTLTNTSNTAQNVVYTVTPISGTCTGATFTITVTVNPKPKIAAKTTTICSASTFSISPSNTSPDIVPTGTTYTWTVVDNANVVGDVAQPVAQSNISVSSALTTAVNSTQNVVYTVTPTSGTCVGPTFSATVTINPLPKIADFAKNICTGTSFDATPTDNSPTQIVPAGTKYTWGVPVLSPLASITGASAQTAVSTISQTLTNTTSANATATYAVTANTTSTPVCSSTFNVVITVEPKIQPVVTCGTSTASTIEFKWTNIPSASYSYVYKVGAGGVNSAPVSLASGTTSEVVSGLSAGNTVFFTLTPVGVLCPLDKQISCANCLQPTITNSNVATPTDFEICVGEQITLKSSDVPTLGTQWVNADATIVSGAVQVAKDQYKITGLKPGTVDITFTNDATCVNSVKITVNPSPTISDKTSTICSGSSFSVSPSNTLPDIVPTGTTYSWTVTPPVGITGASSQATGQSSISQTLTNTTNAPINVTYVVTASSGVSPNICTDNFNLVVTVNPKPSIASKTQTICSATPFSITPSNTSPDIVPTGITYTWAVTPPVGITGANTQSSPQSVISETLTNSTSSAINVSYAVTATSGVTPNTCSNTFTATITVNPSPLIATKNAEICTGSSFSITPTNTLPDIVPTGTTYTWTVTPPLGITGASAQATAQNTIGQTLNNSLSTDVTVTYKVVASAGVSPAICTSNFDALVVVHPVAKIASKTATICSEASFTVTPTNTLPDVVPTGTTYTWTVAPVTNLTGLSAQGTAQSTVSQSITNSVNTPLNAVYVVTASSGSTPYVCTSSFTTTVTVNPKPAISDKTSAICTDNAFTVSPVNTSPDVVPTGTQYTWTVIPPSGITGASTQASLQTNISETLFNSTSNSIDVLYVVTASSGVSPTVCSSTFNTTVTVNPKPSIADKTAIVCSGSSFSVTPSNTLPDIVPTGTTYSWTVTPPAGITGASSQATKQNSIGQSLTNTTNAPIDVTYAVTGYVGSAPNICTVNFNIVVTVNPKPSIASKTQTICSATPFSITPSNTSPDIVPTGITYTWAVTPPIGITGANTQSSPQSVISETLTNSTSSAINVSYAVTATSGVTPNTCSNTFTATITVNPLPVISAKTAIICTNTSFTVTPANTLPDIVPTGTTYTWTVPSVVGITGSSDQVVGQTAISQTLINTTSAPLDVVYHVVASAGTSPSICTSNFDVTVTVNPIPVIAPKTATVCTGVAFDVTPTNTLPDVVPTATTYTWTVSPPAGITGASLQAVKQTTISQTLTNTTNTSINVPYVVTAYTGTAPNVCSITFNATITVNPTPVIALKTATICTDGVFTITPSNTSPDILPIGTTYTWSVTPPAGITGATTQSSPQSSISETLTNSTSSSINVDYTVTATSGVTPNTCSSTFTATITVHPRPLIGAKTATICSGKTFTVLPTNTLPDVVPQATSYTWTVNAPVGITGASAQGSAQNSISQTLSNSTSASIDVPYVVSATSGVAPNTCVSTFTTTVTVNPNPKPLPTANTPCQGSDLVLLSNTPSMTTYAWVGPFPVGTITSASDITISNAQPGINEGDYTLTVTDNNGCVGSKTITQVKVTPTDIVVFAKDIITKCQNDAIFTLQATPSGGSWSSADPVVDAQGSFNPAVTAKGYTVKYTTNGVCPTNRDLIVNINPVPKVLFSAEKEELCEGDSLRLFNFAPELNTKYVWDFGNGVKSTEIIGRYVYSVGGDYDIKLSANLNGCRDSLTKPAYIHVVAKPKDVNFTQSATEIDFYNPEISFTTTTVANYYYWTFSDGKSSTMQNPKHTFPEEPGEYRVRLTASSLEGGCSNSIEHLILMPEPVIYFIPNTFTPNGDELNNTFQPVFTLGYDPQHYAFYIYNRWGELVFETHDTKVGWDGTYGDKLVMHDTYVWKLEFKEKIKDIHHVQTGHVNIVR